MCACLSETAENVNYTNAKVRQSSRRDKRRETAEIRTLNDSCLVYIGVGQHKDVPKYMTLHLQKQLKSYGCYEHLETPCRKFDSWFVSVQHCPYFV
jgi:hypothetical protein